ncbi:CocE/NonD family hydrolase [Alicyclobacillus tolerans]|uniref:CocE/NonD family hydrolase n=1 Tax=Alicyclobacillus tolerans TaxID=90970 RepID=UPI001F00E24F|nr:CocE/NonD family hydrolase [Alicyclobacillus tolerans]MCF8566691.1 CocE/NonD family hydrolase [Alicyclobacillus tolerans]
MKDTEYYDVRVQRDAAIPMRDGVALFADIYSPVGEGQFPALLMRSPYDKSHSEFITYMHPEWYARQGFIVVTQDVRGKYASEGEFRPYHFERQDGADTIRFVKSLPKCNGKIGMYGFSYVGATQLHASVEAPEELTAIAPAFTNDGYYEDWSYKNGALLLAFLQSWSVFLAPDQAARKGHPDEIGAVLDNLNHICEGYGHLPLNDHPKISREFAPYYYEWLEHPTFDDYWKQWHLGDMSSFSTPALHIGGWYDVFLQGTLRNYRRMTTDCQNEQVRASQKLVIGPWYHMPWSQLVGEADFGQDGGNVVNDVQLRWFQHWLQGVDNGVMDEPPVSIFVMGENKWRQEHQWPLARTQYTKFYIHSAGGANSLTGDGWLDTGAPQSEPADLYVYNPFDPVPSLGGHSCCIAGLTPMGPKDQRPVEIRNDVLVYFTAPLQEDVELTGPVDAVIYASSTADDTDFTVKLVDVHPDGKSINLLEGIQRASYRESNDQPSPIVPGEIYEYRFCVGSTSNLFKAGHRIGVEISSSNFPAFDRNLNRFHVNKDAGYTDIQNATQKIYHDAAHPTHLVLPVIPRQNA